MERIEFISRSPSDTVGIGERIGRSSRDGDLFLICGELGAGKTQFVKGLAKGLDVPDWEYVVSPSFTLLNAYTGRRGLCHVDLYRLQDGDVEDLGIEEYLDGVVAVEWAEKSSWWDNSIKVSIGVVGEEERRIVLEVEDVGRAKVWRNIRCNDRENRERRKTGD
ncbi:MAG: tRNA (adenosine(37)-N6)-threonylcarbamoyltransferase complex ATPase subunit type 1 TsaE [Syntrophorhabdales bacterium]